MTKALNEIDIIRFRQLQKKTEEKIKLDNPNSFCRVKFM